MKNAGEADVWLAQILEVSRNRRGNASCCCRHWPRIFLRYPRTTRFWRARRLYPVCLLLLSYKCITPRRNGYLLALLKDQRYWDTIEMVLDLNLDLA
jgi:hypothetical protein